MQHWGNPEVSIVMAVYNEKNYIRQTIDSILQQTFISWEFIIVLDSNDEELFSILNSYAENDLRFKVIKNQTNLGLTKSLNIAILASSGNFIARLDADDIALPDRLEKQLKYLQENKTYSVVGSWAMVVNENGIVVGKIKTNIENNSINRSLLIKNQFIHSSVMIKRDVFKQYGLYNEDFLRSQDYELWLRLRGRIFFYNIPEFLIQYRSHESSITKKYNIEQRLTGIRMMYSFVKNNKYELNVFEIGLTIIYFLKTFIKILKSTYFLK